MKLPKKGQASHRDTRPKVTVENESAAISLLKNEVFLCGTGLQPVLDPATEDIAPVTNRCHTFSTAC